MPQPKMVVPPDVKRVIWKMNAIGMAFGTVAAMAAILLLPAAWRGFPAAVAIGLGAGLIGFVIAGALKLRRWTWLTERLDAANPEQAAAAERIARKARRS